MRAKCTMSTGETGRGSAYISYEIIAAMSDLPLYDSMDDLPEPLPRSEMRFDTVGVDPYADGRRVRLRFRLLPFEERPSVDAWIDNAQGQTVAMMSVIEAMEQEFEFTLHLRGPEPRGAHTLHLQLFYIASDDRPDEKQIVDRRELVFDIANPY